MKKFFAFAFAALVLVSCDKEESTTDSSFAMKASAADYNTACALPVQTVSGDITSSVTWTSDRVWQIDGVVRVKSGAVLTIQAGTFIKALPKTGNVATGVLVITKTGSINALGTVDAPIVFTSYNLLDCDPDTIASPGDFGGVVILGDAQVNTGVTNNVIEGLGDQPSPEDFYYGGTTTAGNGHNAGTFRYVRIEFAGRKLPTQGENGVEINGLTLGGVGSGTVIDYVEVSYGLDDAFEFFGGTVSPNHLIALAQDDDAFDFDFGYTGSIDRMLAIANKNATHSLSGTAPDSNGIELDNDATTTDDNTPFTRPVLNHLSIFGVASSTDGSLLENAVHVRRKGRLILRNSTVSGYNNGIFIENPSLSANSTFVNVEANAFLRPATIDNATTATLSGVANSTSSTASSFGTTTPFYSAGNSPALDFSTTARTSGAFSTGDTTWTGSWTKFSAFQAVNE